MNDFNFFLIILKGEFYEEEIEVFSEKHEKETKTGRKEEESEACSSDLTQRVILLM